MCQSPISRASTPAQGPSTTPLPTFTRRLNSFESSERHAVAGSSTNTEEPPDQPRHSFGHPQAAKRASELFEEGREGGMPVSRSCHSQAARYPPRSTLKIEETH